MSKLILIFLLMVSFSYGSLHEELYVAKIVKPKCKELYLDYKFFRNKAINSQDGLDSRWFKISNSYKKKFRDCNDKDIRTKRYYAPNPYNKIQ